MILQVDALRCPALSFFAMFPCRAVALRLSAAPLFLLPFYPHGTNVMSPLFVQYGIKGFAFDFDGTLAVPTLDFALMRHRVATAVQNGARIHVEERGPLLESLVRATAYLSPEHAAQVRQLADEAIKEVELEAASRSRLFPFVRPLLAVFRSHKLPFAIVTRNCPEAVLTVFPDLHEHCACLVTREDVAHVKPHPAHLRKALSALGIAARHVLMVGDHAMDIEVGKLAGSLTAGVASGEMTEALLAESGPDFLATDAGALMERLGLM